jgi:hypothetical protein
VADTKTNLVLQARNAATAALIEKHQEEWDDLMEKECAARGAEWVRPLTAEQKAANDIKAILDKYPHLAVQFVAGTPEDAAAFA